MTPPPPPQITEAQWPTFKPFIEREYLTFNRPAQVVVDRLQSFFNVTTSVRRLKLKFDAWRWDKKIRAINYAAMVRVIQEVGQQTVFIVPKMGGRVPFRVEAKKIIKETNRKKSNNERIGKPNPPNLDLETARNILEEAGITFEHHRPAHAQPRLAAHRTQSTANWPTTLERPTQDLTERPDDDDDDDNDDDDDEDDDGDDACTTVSDESMPDASMPETDAVQDSSRELNLQNFPTEARLRRPQSTEGWEQRRMTGVLPFAAAYLADLHCNVFPHIAEYRLTSPPITIARHCGGNADVGSNPQFLSNNYTDDLGLNPTPELPASQRFFREKLIEQTLSENYHRQDHDGHRRMALEFSGYYVVHVLAGHEVPDDYAHVDRNDARNRLCAMLEHNNMQLLTHCYWVSSITMSYDKIRLLLAFFEDCIDCIETSTSYLGHVLRPWIRLMVLNHRREYGHYAVQSPRLSPAALEQMDRNFNASQELLESMDHLSQRGHGGSHAQLILRLYHAWNLCHEDNSNGGLIELLGCLPLAEVKFGLEHLVTINCTSMVAKAYEKQGNPAMAKLYIDTALTRLMSCSKMLVSRYYQLQQSSAQLLLAEGKLFEARAKLEHVVHYRRQHLGAQAPMTWDAAEMLFDTMSRQGFALEAQQRRAELMARYEEEWTRHAVTIIPRQ